MFFIQQTTQHDCGFTTLKILLANLNKDQNYLYLASPFNRDENISLLELIEEAKRYGLTLKASRCKDKSGLDMNVKVPFIPVINIEGMYHSVYLYKINKKYVYYYDPRGEFKKVDIATFVSMWTGDFLRMESFIPTKCPIEKPKLLKLSERLMSLAFTLISGVMLILGVYFINQNSYFYLPIIFLSLMVISEIVMKWYLMNVMKRIDMRIECYFDEIKNHDYASFHHYYEHYKSALILNDVNHYASFLVVVIIVIIMLLNEKMNVVFIGVNLFLGAIHIFITAPWFYKKANIIEYKESLLNNAEDKIDAFNNIYDIRGEAYHTGNILHILKYLVIFIQIFTSLMMMLYFNIMNVTYILCYTVIQMYLYHHLCEVFEEYDKKEKNNNLLVKLIALFEKKK